VNKLAAKARGQRCIAIDCIAILIVGATAALIYVSMAQPNAAGLTAKNGDA